MSQLEDIGSLPKSSYLTRVTFLASRCQRRGGLVVSPALLIDSASHLKSPDPCVPHQFRQAQFI